MNLEKAHARFRKCVSNGISSLRESGFSRQRAIEVLLKHIRQQDELPNDNEVRYFNISSNRVE